MSAKPHDPDAIVFAEREADERIKVAQVPYDPESTSDAWMDLSRCRDEDPETFFPLAGSAAEIVAQMTCAECPVTQWCRQRRYELGAVGFWAGVLYEKTTGTRRPCATAKCSKPVMGRNSHYCGFEHAHAAKVGTAEGYALHRREGVDPCRACLDAQARRNLKYKDPREGGHGARQPRVMHSGTRVPTA